MPIDVRMKVPALTLPAALVRPASRLLDTVRTGIAAVPRRALVAVGVTLGILFLFLAVGLPPDEASLPETASTVIPIERDLFEAPPPSLLGPAGDGLDANGQPLPPGVSLIAANGAVISDPDLVEMTPLGPLPRIARDGRTAMSVYGRKVDPADTRPRITVVVTGLGMSVSTTQSAIDTLPPTVTLSFSPYGSDLQTLVSAARGNGNEVVLEVPLEPYDFPNNDPGQNTLITTAPVRDNGDRLRWVLSRFTGYAGIMNFEGGKYLASSRDMQMLLDAAHKRGLYFFDSGDSDRSAARDAARLTGASFGRADIIVDRLVSRDTVVEALASVERVAMQKGGAVAVASAYPATIEEIRSWAQSLEGKGFALVPLSAVVRTERVVPARSTPPAPRPSAPRGPSLRPSAPDAAPAADVPAVEGGAAEEPKTGPHP